MKIVIIGLGSMGKRRIRLLTQHYGEIDLIGVDAREDRRSEVLKLHGINTFPSLAEAWKDERPDAAFICTSPVSHPTIALECLDLKLNIFSEINLINENHEVLIRKAKDNDLLYFLSSTPLYRKEIQFIRDKINALENVSHCHYRYHVGQYLPDWHPWESHKDFFVADKRTNGCREILAIELPWIIKAFGKIKSITTKADTISDLELTYPDSYVLLIEHEAGHIGVVNVDVASRKAVRSLEVFGGDIYLTWDGKADGLYDYLIVSGEMCHINVYDNIEKDFRYADNIIENAYLDEIKAFVALLEDKPGQGYYTLEEEVEVLKMIDEIEGNIS